MLAEEELKKRATYFGLDKTKDFEAFKKKYMELADNIDIWLKEDVGIKTIIHEHLHARSSNWEEKH